MLIKLHCTEREHKRDANMTRANLLKSSNEYSPNFYYFYVFIPIFYKKIILSLLSKLSDACLRYNMYFLVIIESFVTSK